MFGPPKIVPKSMSQTKLTELLERVNLEFRKSDMKKRLARLKLVKTICKSVMFFAFVILFIGIALIILKVKDVIPDGVDQAPGLHCPPPCRLDNWGNGVCGTACFKYRDGNHYYNGEYTRELVLIFLVFPLLLIPSIITSCCLVPCKEETLVKQTVGPTLAEWSDKNGPMVAAYRGPGCLHTRQVVPCCGGYCYCEKTQSKLAPGQIWIVNSSTHGAHTVGRQI